MTAGLLYLLQLTAIQTITPYSVIVLKTGRNLPLATLGGSREGYWRDELMCVYPEGLAALSLQKILQFFFMHF